MKQKPFTLPEIDFIGGSTQELVFHCYSMKHEKPIDLSFCTANFALVNFVNKSGDPLVEKEMEVCVDNDEGTANILKVVLSPKDTVSLNGKYIYQITIVDIEGAVDIPDQGIAYISKNINHACIS